MITFTWYAPHSSALSRSEHNTFSYVHLFHAFPAHTQPKTVNFDNTGTRPRLAQGASVFPSGLRGLCIDDGPTDQPLSSVCGPLLSAWDATLGYDGEGPPKSQSTPTEARVRKVKQRELESLRAGGMHKHVRFAPAGLGGQRLTLRGTPCANPLGFGVVCRRSHDNN